MSIKTIKMKDAGGFTIIELAITVAIVGILTTIAMGGYLRWKPGYVFRGAVSQIRGDLEQAKMRALETRKQCRVVFNTNGYQIEDGNRVMNTNAWGSVDRNGVHTAGTPSRLVNFNNSQQINLTQEGNTIVAGTATEPIIVFSPRGTAINDSLQVVHANAGTAEINVNITGNIAITWP